jgi:hypothetical protein
MNPLSGMSFFSAFSWAKSSELHPMTNTNATSKMHAFFVATSFSRNLADLQLNPFFRFHFVSVADEINGQVDTGELVLVVLIGGDLFE